MAYEVKTMIRDDFGNPVYGRTSLVNPDDARHGVPFSDNVKDKFKANGDLDGTDETIVAFLTALEQRWHEYGCQIMVEWDEDDAVAYAQMVGDWIPELERMANSLWRRYQPIVEAYKTKVDWQVGITNTTTYKDVKDTSTNEGHSTDYALPNKKVEAPYGTPTSHSDNNGGHTNTKTGAVETKGMLNPVAQRDLYARLIRDAYGEMAEECAPLFNQMHL